MFTDILTNFKKKAQELDQVALKLPKKDQETVKRFTASIIQEFNSNMPFFMECFYEQMETVAQEIKSNLEADVMHKLTTLGLETLQQKQLEEKL